MFFWKGDVHTQFVTQNIKMTFLGADGWVELKKVFGLTHPRTPENVRSEQIFCCCKNILRRYHWNQNMQMTYLLYHDNFIRPKQKILQSKKQNPLPRFTHGTHGFIKSPLKMMEMLFISLFST